MIMDNRFLVARRRYDPDATRYINAVQLADGQALEPEVAMAVDAFVRGCKADGIWSAMKASCIMCGARTISGALVPLRTPYGAELWSPASFIAVTDSGTAGSWDGESLTFSNASGSLTSYPRFLFDAGFQLNRRYRISGRLAGDIQTARLLKPRFSSEQVFVDATTGEFDGIALQSSSSPQLEIQFNSTAKSDFSVTIESLSIREDSFTPTPYNFASGDYDRTTGLKGDGATKYLDSNRACNADGQDDHHLAVYKSSTGDTLGKWYAGTSESGTPSFSLVGEDGAYSRTTTSLGAFSNTASTGLFGVSRQSSATASYIRLGVVTSVSATSYSPDDARNNLVFGRNDSGGPTGLSNARLAFYSIGSALSLESLDARVSTLVSAIAAAI